MKKLAVMSVLMTLTMSALGHHSNAMFDLENVIELQGTVVEFQFTNPHTWLQVDVAGDQGDKTEWSLEWGSPNNLGRQGVRPSTFPPGSQVIIRTNPMKDGSPGGLLVGAKLANGKTVGRWE